MKISDLFGKVNNYSSGKVGGKHNSNAEEALKKFSNEDGSDRTTISSKAVLLSTVSRINSEDDVARAERVQALKQKVATGEYLDEVSTEKVAKKVNDYLFDRA